VLGAAHAFVAPSTTAAVARSAVASPVNGLQMVATNEVVASETKPRKTRQVSLRERFEFTCLLWTIALDI
jgi:hypothetical protein